MTGRKGWTRWTRWTSLCAVLGVLLLASCSSADVHTTVSVDDRAHATLLIRADGEDAVFVARVSDPDGSVFAWASGGVEDPTSIDLGERSPGEYSYKVYWMLTPQETEDHPPPSDDDIIAKGTKIEEHFTVHAPSTPPSSESSSGTANAPRTTIAAVHADDPSGDVLPLGYGQPTRQPALADLRSADLESDGNNLTIKLTVGESIPQTSPAEPSEGAMSHLEFGVQFDAGSSFFNLGASVWEDGWSCFGGDLAEDELDPPQVNGNVIVITVPLDLVPELAHGFKWIAYTDCGFRVSSTGEVTDDMYGDRLPGTAKGSFSSEDPSLAFPGG
jgi:hypothetical protein